MDLAPLTSERRIEVTETEHPLVVIVSHPSKRPRLDRDVEDAIVALVKNGFFAGSITRPATGLGVDWYPADDPAR